MFIKLSALGLLSISFVLAGFPRVADANECERRLPKRFVMITGSAAGGSPDISGRALSDGLRAVSRLEPVIQNASDAELTPVYRVASNKSNILAVGIFGRILSHPELWRANSKVKANAFDILAAFDGGNVVWITRKKEDLSTLASRTVVFASSRVADELIGGGMPAKALDLTVAFATGYSGSADRYAAILRGEADINIASVSSAKRVLPNGQLSVLLSISHGPNTRYPDAPYLIGEGGLVSQATNPNGYQLAEAAVSLSRQTHYVVISKKVPPEIRSCLSSLIDRALVTSDFRDRMRALQADVEPLDAKSARELWKRLSLNISRYQTLIDNRPKDSGR